jgi:geranylgeranyl diphosphate synthase type II
MIKRVSTPADLLEAYQAFAVAQKFDRQPATLYDPIRYAMAGKGKAVRPLLLLMAARLGSEDISHALPAAYALELFHNFTLLHDDIMDEAPLRRGMPSVHIAYGNASAILAGDAMLIHTYGYLLDNYEGNLAHGLLSIFQRMAIALCEGQQRDMDMESSDNATYASYLEMIHGKTGVLITAALEMGAILGGLSPKQCETVHQAGDWAGRAFQLQDDLLDTFRSSSETGKSDFGDIVRGKQSAPYLHALQLANSEDRRLLRHIYALSVQERSSKIDEVLEVMNRLNVEKSLSNEVLKASDQCKALLRTLAVRPEPLADLTDFLDSLSVRRH